MFEFVHEPNNRGTGLRGSGGRFNKSPRTSKTQRATLEKQRQLNLLPPPIPDYGGTTTTLQKSVTLGRGQPKLIWNQHNSCSDGRPLAQTNQQQSNTGPLTIVAENMTDAEVDRFNENARKTNTHRKRY